VRAVVLAMRVAAVSRALALLCARFTHEAVEKALKMSHSGLEGATELLLSGERWFVLVLGRSCQWNLCSLFFVPCPAHHVCFFVQPVLGNMR